MIKLVRMLFVFVGFLGLASNSFAADVTMRISIQLPMKSNLGQNLLLFKNDVEKKSNGEIEVQIYDSAQLYKDKEVPAAVGSGSIESGVASLTRYVGDIPAVDLFYQPFLLNSEEKVRKAVAKGSSIRGPIDKAIEGTGSTVLWWQAYGSAIMLSKGEAIKNPSDMKGKKVRVFGKTLGAFISFSLISKPFTSCPPLIIFAAIGPPIVPNPIKPIFVILSLSNLLKFCLSKHIYKKSSSLS